MYIPIERARMLGDNIIVVGWFQDFAPKLPMFTYFLTYFYL